MCGRYGRRGDKQKIAEAFEVTNGLDELYEFDDCAPGSLQPAIRLNDNGEREFSQMRWGFKFPDRFVFNSCSEGVETSKFWKKLLPANRCIVPTSSFFEWNQVSKTQKDKYEITVSNWSIFGMAGLWSPWNNPKTDEWEKTFSIITTDPNAAMQPFHDRQPVILAPNEFREWLEPNERPPLHLMRPLPEEQMATRQMSAAPSAKPEAAMRGLFD